MIKMDDKIGKSNPMNGKMSSHASVSSMGDSELEKPLLETQHAKSRRDFSTAVILVGCVFNIVIRYCC